MYNLTHAIKLLTDHLSEFTWKIGEPPLLYPSDIQSSIWLASDVELIIVIGPKQRPTSVNTGYSTNFVRYSCDKSRMRLIEY